MIRGEDEKGGIERTLPKRDVKVALLVRAHPIKPALAPLFALLCHWRPRELDKRPSASKIDRPARKVIVDHFELAGRRVDEVEERVVGREGEAV